MKHVEIYLLFIRETVTAGHVIVNFVPTPKQVVEILTKPLTEKMFVHCRKKLEIFSVFEINDTSISDHMELPLLTYLVFRVSLPVLWTESGGTLTG